MMTSSSTKPSVAPPPRSRYAEKLRSCGNFVLSDERAFGRRGRWAELFLQRIGPTFGGRIVLEIGCSNALFLATVAADCPGTGFVGLDWKCKSIYDGAQRITGLGLNNVVLVRGRGQDVPGIFAAAEIDEVWVFHPDPCDRDVELKNRLIREPFLNDVHDVLKDRASIVALKTDHPGYYQWLLGLFGLPEPVWFDEARSAREARAADPGAGHLRSHPRVRAPDLMRGCDIPRPSDALRRKFAVDMRSADYWNDPVALAHTQGRSFARHATPYESRFIKKRLPIYYFEMRKS